MKKIENQKMFIHNFRIFNGLYELDFNNKDLIIISGPNGNGKSTIFDSIQWCLTGKIPAMMVVMKSKSSTI